MKKYTHIYLFLPLFFGSCNVLIKSQINKKYPPLAINQIRDSLLRRNLKIDESIKPDIGVSIQDSITKTIIFDEFKKAKDVEPSLGIKYIDSLSLNYFELVSSKQSCKSKLSTKFYISNKEDKILKNIKWIELELDGMVFPEYSNSILHLNPAFKRIHINKIRFKNIFHRFFSPPVTSILNNLIGISLENLNGVAKNVKINISDSIVKSLSISEITKDAKDINVVKDDTLLARIYFYNTFFLIDSGRICLSSKISATPNQKFNLNPFPSYLINDDIINYMNNEYTYKYLKAWTAAFDNTSTFKNYTIINYRSIFSVIQENLKKLDFTIKYSLSKSDAFPRKYLKFVNNFNCDQLVKDAFNCVAEAADKCCINTPFGKICDPTGFCWLNVIAACEATIAARGLLCWDYTKKLAELFNNIGYVEGNARMEGEISINVRRPLMYADTIMIPLKLNTDNTSSAVLRFSFIPTGPAGFMLCELPVKNQDLNFNLSANKDLSLKTQYKIEQQGDTALNMTLKTDGFDLNIEYSPSIIENLITHPMFSINCNFLIPGIGIAITASAIINKIACEVDNDGQLCAYSRTFLDAFLRNLYKINIQGQQKIIPINVPKYKIDNYTLRYKYNVTEKYISVEHLFRDNLKISN